jgi:hypothetical protein
LLQQISYWLGRYRSAIGMNCARTHVDWHISGFQGSAEFRNAFNKEGEAGGGDALRVLRALAEPGGGLAHRALKSASPSCRA